MNLTDEEWDGILTSIQKLNNLKDHPGTEGEAVAATEAIQRKMTKYNITMQDLSNKQNRDAKGRFSHQNYKFNTKTLWLTEWKAVLLQELAKCYFCRAVFSRKDGVSTIIGEERSIRVLSEVLEFLIKYIRLECNRAWRLEELKGTSKKREIRYRVGFYAGAVDRIAERVAEQKRAIALEFSGSTALVVQTDEELNREIAKITSGNRMRNIYVDGEGYESGKIAGNSAKIQEEVQ